jgi:hypothetical protein
VRLASPGDDGDLAQTIATQAAATVADVTAAVQQVAQVVPTLPPPVPVPASASGPPVEAFADTPGIGPANVVQSQIDDGPAVGTGVLGADDAPRHGGQALLASWRPGGATAAPQASWRVRGIQALRASEPTRAPLVFAQLIHPSSAADDHHSAGAARPPARVLPPPVPAPPLDAPLSTLVAMSPLGPQQTAGSGLVALATDGLGLFLLFFASYLVPLSRAVRARAGVAEPHPPG